MTGGQPPWLWLIGGPNGAGKTTLAYSVLGRELPDVFVNADEIAKGLSPGYPDRSAIQAGRLVMRRIGELVSTRTSFVVESTLSSLNYHRLACRVRSMGWRVGLVFVWVASADLSVRRVAARVSRGGHHVPEADVRRRWVRATDNLAAYASVCDQAMIYDNSDRPTLVAWMGGGRTVIFQPSAPLVERLCR